MEKLALTKKSVTLPKILVGFALTVGLISLIVLATMIASAAISVG